MVHAPTSPDVAALRDDVYAGVQVMAIRSAELGPIRSAELDPIRSAELEAIRYPEL